MLADIKLFQSSISTSSSGNVCTHYQVTDSNENNIYMIIQIGLLRLHARKQTGKFICKDTQAFEMMKNLTSLIQRKYRSYKVINPFQDIGEGHFESFPYIKFREAFHTSNGCPFDYMPIKYGSIHALAGHFQFKVEGFTICRNKIYINFVLEYCRTNKVVWQSFDFENYEN